MFPLFKRLLYKLLRMLKKDFLSHSELFFHALLMVAAKGKIQDVKKVAEIIKNR